ncbi:MAG: hypothetical protein JWQ04_118 [Pedosphaera sp.]|nr:hypothetical protein [Pedosphaera sp.]
MNVVKGRVSAGLLAGFLLSVLVTGASAQSNLLADFKLKSDGTDALGNCPPMSLNNVSFANGALQLPAGNYVAAATINGFSYNSFTVAVDFNPTDLSTAHETILTGGPLYRWLGLITDGDGHLEIYFNNRNLLYSFTNSIQTNAWHTLFCSVDLPSQTVVTFLDGQHLPDINLSSFTFDVIGTPDEEEDKAFSFVDDGDAIPFYGAAANLRVYNRALSAAEIASLMVPTLSLQLSGQSVLISWPVSANGYQLLSTSALAPPVSWTTNSASPLLIGSQNVIIESMDVERFYRLKKF